MENTLPLDEVVQSIFDTVKVFIDKYGLGLSKHQHKIKQYALETILKDGFNQEVHINDIPRISQRIVEAPILYTEQNKIPFNLQDYRKATYDTGMEWNQQAKNLGIGIY